MIILGIVILLATVYALIKQYETKMILFASGLLLCILGGSPMNAFEAFATRMTTGSLIQPIPVSYTHLSFYYLVTLYLL